MTLAALDLWTPPEERYAPMAKAQRRPREYQLAALNAWRFRDRAIREHAMVVFTGAGKTFIASHVAKEEPGRLLFVVNRDRLGKQSIEKLQQDTGKRWEMEQADQWATVNGSANVVTLIQTLMQPKRFQRFPVDAFAGIILDEAHRLRSPKFRRAIDHFTGAWKLNLTATLIDGMGDIPRVFDMPLARAQAEAWSVPFDFHPVEVDVNLDKVQWSKGDFQAAALDETMCEQAAAIARAAVDMCQGRTLIVCPGVKTLIAASDAINQLRPGSARPLYGELDAREGKGKKDQTIADHQAGKFQFLVSCDMVREGYDDELITDILIARPMAKRHDFEQVVGRGSRLWPGVGDITDEAERRAAIAASPKPVCRVIDLACVSLKHDLASIVDVLGAAYTAKEKGLAKKRLKSGGDPMKALEYAREEIRRRELAAQAARDARVAFKPVKTQADVRTTTSGEEAASLAQLRRLEAFGIPCDKETTKAQAKKLLGREFVAEKFKWCDYRQRQFLETWVGVRNAWMLPRTTGSLLVAVWKRNGRRRLSPEQIREVIGGVS